MNDDVGSIYFGGGTPSILTETDLEKILNEIHKKFKISNHAEITIECNPDDEFLSVNSLGFSEEIIIYPNPSSDYININYDEEIWKLQIINMNGEKIDVKPSKSSIDISFLSKGIYILNFNNNFINACIKMEFHTNFTTQIMKRI